MTRKLLSRNPRRTPKGRRYFGGAFYSGIFALLLVLRAAPLLPAQSTPDALPSEAGISPQKPAGRPSVALVLAGGGAKGYAHIPVLELIEELNIPVDMVIGTSAGAIIGGLYCAGYSPQMMKEVLFDMDWNTIFFDRPAFFLESRLGDQDLARNPLHIKFSRSLSLNIGRGISTGQEAYKLFRSLTAKIPSYINFDTLSIPFRATGVELTDGKLELFDKGDLAEAIRASMSLPAIFEPFNIDGKYYLDGGVLNNLPVDMAKAMGYDIVIAVELPTELLLEMQAFDTSPLAVLNQTLTIYSYSAREFQYALADTVLIPQIEKYSIIDFPKAREIYAQSAKQKEEFREALLGVRRKIYGDDSAMNGGGVIHAGAAQGDRYSDKNYITVQDMRISGGVAFDEKYIRREFDRLLRGQPATKERLAAFTDAVYQTGNYTFVLTRIDTRGAYPVLELRLVPFDLRNSYLALGLGLQVTLSSDVFIKGAISFDAQMRGLTGPGSVLAFGVTPLGILSIHGLFFQPVNQKLFFTGRVQAVQDQDLSTSGFTWQGRKGNSIISAGLDAGLGYKLDKENTFFVKASWFAGVHIDSAIDYFSFAYDIKNGVNAQTLGLSAGWEFNTLDHQVFPHRGLFLNIENSTLFPVGGSKYTADIVSADFSTALPIAEKFILSLNAFAGGEITGTMKEHTPFTLLRGFNTADRLFFPQISGRQRYGASKTAVSAAVRFQPFSNALDVYWFLGFSGAAGSVYNDPQTLSREDLYWNMSVNAGIRFTRSFGLIFRLGAGKGVRPETTPLISVDLGSLRY
jgi:NTE family protein